MVWWGRRRGGGYFPPPMVSTPPPALLAAAAAGVSIGVFAGLLLAKKRLSAKDEEADGSAACATSESALRHFSQLPKVELHVHLDGAFEEVCG